jgi:transposase-like protein
MSTRTKSRGGRPAKFPPEFRGDSVAMALDDGRPITEIGRSPG